MPAPRTDSRDLPPVPDDRWAPTSITRGDALAFAGTRALIAASIYDEAIGGVYVSRDAGLTWVRLPGDAAALACVPALLIHRQRIVAGTVGGGVFVHDGRAWHPSDTGLPADATVLTLGAGNGLVLSGTQDGRLLASLDGAASWFPLELDGRPGAIRGILKTGGGFIVAHARGLHRLNRVDDIGPKGFTWRSRRLAGPDGGAPHGLVSGRDGTIYGWTPTTILRASAGGAAWMPLRLPTAPGDHIQRVVASSDLLAMAGQSAAGGFVHASADGGFSWMEFVDGLPPAHRGLSLGGIGETLLAGIGGYGIWRRRIAAVPIPG